MSYTILTAEEAASLINNGDTIAFSAFTPAGAAKAVSLAIAGRAKAEHAAGREYKINAITGASGGQALDGALAEADAVNFRAPYQSNASMRGKINCGAINFVDMHLSMVAQYMNYGFMGKIDWAVVEAADISDNGEIVLTASVGISPTALKLANKIIIERNAHHPKKLRGIHDIYETANPPHRREIPIYGVSDRIGSETVKVDPKKIVGIVETNFEDGVAGFKDADEATTKVGENVANFLAAEMLAGRVPNSFLPIQSGVGNIANAVLAGLGKHPDIPPFTMYSEVLQDSVVDMLAKGNMTFASATSLTVTDKKLAELYANIDFFRNKIALRPQEISNHPEVIRRLGVISVNTAIEVDVFGNVNSSHIMGKNIMNGIGGSGDFTRNAYISIFTTPATAKGGAISAIVPLCSHMDHSEHSVNIIVTEYGVADMRNKTPLQRAKLIIENCAAPEYRDLLRSYLASVATGHTPQTLSKAYTMHEAFVKEGDMRKAVF